MHLLLTLPITLRSLVKPKKLDFNPVVMSGPLPSKSPDLWRRFLKPGGKTVAISASDSAKVRAYMQEHSTEAISEDGLVAFTLQDDGFLVECLPDQLVEADAMAL
ncbi:hypothetical protein [Hydrogenophaga sp.]|uniref:hypothetical protein n=1 Tax=Hydrogenophaga sp. TaxID=1904254 RepID=UPI002615D650|nr:hypothetical protein [Hydrogenophaga sp.]